MGRIKTRANWHKSCVQEYKILYWPSETTKFIRKRDRGICAKCGTKTKNWQVDHIKPLIEAKGNIDYWKSENLQTLCVDCHKEKTSFESTQRAKMRKSHKY
jgi:5-methylcytosine-specific restriction endonuclease McrA